MDAERYLGGSVLQRANLPMTDAYRSPAVGEFDHEQLTEACESSWSHTGLHRRRLTWAAGVLSDAFGHVVLVLVEWSNLDKGPSDEPRFLGHHVEALCS